MSARKHIQSKSNAKANRGNAALLNRSWSPKSVAQSAAKSPTTSTAGSGQGRSRVAAADRADRYVLPGLQAKMIVGEVNSPLEREADQVADRVMGMSTPLSFAGASASAEASGQSGGGAGSQGRIQRQCPVCGGVKETLQRKCSGCVNEEQQELEALRKPLQQTQAIIQREALATEEEEDETETLRGKMNGDVLQRTEQEEDDIVKKKSDSQTNSNPSPSSVPTVSAATESSIRSMRNSGGAPLPSAEMSFFSERIGETASAARIHTGSAASQAAADVGARAFTLGHDVFFNRGEYQPGTDAGRRLMAHELAHVGQNRAGGVGAISREVLRRQPSTTKPADLNKNQGKKDKPKTDSKGAANFEAAKKNIDVTLEVGPGTIRVKLDLNYELSEPTYHGYLFTRKIFLEKLKSNKAALAKLPFPFRIVDDDKTIKNEQEFLEYCKNHFESLVGHDPDKNQKFVATLSLFGNPKTGKFSKKPGFFIGENTCLIVDTSQSMNKLGHKKYLAWRIRQSLEARRAAIGKKKIKFYLRKFFDNCDPDWITIEGNGLGHGGLTDGGVIGEIFKKLNVPPINSNPGRPTSADDCRKKPGDTKEPKDKTMFDAPGGCVWKSMNNLGGKKCDNVILFTDLEDHCYLHARSKTIPTHVEQIRP